MVDNLPNYSRFDVLRCFLSLQDSQSRKHLSGSLEVGEGTMRTLLNILKEKGLISSSAQGHALTASGIQVLSQLHSAFDLKRVDIPLSQFQSLKKAACHIKKPASQPAVVSLRDTAVKNGAEACLIFQQKEQFQLFGGRRQREYQALSQLFPLQKNHLLVLTLANQQRWAEIAALAASEKIVDSIKQFMQQLYSKEHK